MKKVNILFLIMVATGLFYLQISNLSINKFISNKNNTNLTCSNKSCLDLNINNEISLGGWFKTIDNSSTSHEQILISKWKQSDNAFFDKSNYSIMDITKLNPDAKGYAGAVFDGRYIYFIPIENDLGQYSGLVSRFDTTGLFTLPSSWSFFDTSRVNPNAKGFGGGVFDGRYVYFVPNYGDGYLSGLVTRFDTTGLFTLPSSWSFFDTSRVNPNSKGFWGGVFDGRYIYFVPHHNESGKFYGQVTRYDTRKSFSLPSSWSFFDTEKLNSKSKGFVGAIFDGRYVYFVPNRNSITDFHGQVTRYDTKGSFLASSSWSFFDTEKLNPKSRGFAGGVFDGRYIYFTPLFDNTEKFNGQITKYDTKSSFTSSSSWSFFDTTKITPNSKGFIGAVFDGRYVYFVPFRKSYEDDVEKQTGGFNGLIMRYDTTGSFTSYKSWSSFEATNINPSIKGFWGAVYDGRYVYFVPDKILCHVYIGQVLRFDTTGNNHGSYRLLYSQNNQNGSFSGSPFGPRFEINTTLGNYSVSYNHYLSTGTWHHIVGTFNGKSLQLFIDGDLTAENADIPPDLSIIKTTDPLVIASPAEQNNNYFNGLLNELFIYDRKLDVSEVKEIYKSSLNIQHE